jgi:hypothetical protein
MKRNLDGLGIHVRIGCLDLLEQIVELVEDHKEVDIEYAPVQAFSTRS